ncbi:MAG: flagellar basal-body MS-ring/collar protein FliF [Endomicrobiaceae bacterium]|jgi:flagellar M-ring protein FliF
MKENLTHIWTKIQEVYSRMELRQRLTIAILLAVTFGIIITMISFSSRIDYGLLFARLAPEDAQKTIEKLNELAIPFKLRDEGSSIWIPSDKVYETRISLASENIGLKSSGVGFEIFDKTSLGVTEFVQKNVNYRRAMEGELQRTIISINGIDFVRVHLVFPEEKIFKEDQQEPSASVMLRLNKKLSEKQIDGISNLIASAVEGLDSSKITIVDQDGKILSDNFEDSITGLSSQQTKMQVQVENQLMLKVQSMLDQILDVGNSVVRVTAEINFDQLETTTETFDPEGQIVRSEEIQVNNITNLKDSLSQVNEHQITNYEIGSTVQRRVSQVGDVRRLTVAVNVNYKSNRRFEDGKEIIEYIERSPAEIAQIEASVRNAIGFNADRGDQIVVNSMQFDRSEIEFAKQEQEAKEQREELKELIINGAVVVVLIVLVFVLISQFKKIFAKPITEEEEEALRPAYADGDASSEGFYPEGEEGMPMGEGKISYTFKPMKDIAIEQTEAILLQEAIQKFVIENPEVAVRLIKSWLLDSHPLVRSKPKDGKK